MLPEHRDRVEALFVELQIYQYRTGWGGPYPSYKTPLAEFARQIKVLRISHRVHIGSLIAFFSLILIGHAMAALDSATVLPWVMGLAVFVAFASQVWAGRAICPRCKKPFHHRWVLFSIIETQCLNCGFHLWNNDGL